MATHVDELIAQVRSLAPGDRERVRQALEQAPDGESLQSEAADEQAREEEFMRRLVAKGLLSEIKRPRRDVESFRRWEPIEIEGQPLSETIIEERR